MGQRANTAGTRHSGTHKVSGKPEHQGSRLSAAHAGVKNLGVPRVASVISAAEAASIPRLTRPETEPSKLRLVQQEDLTPAHHLDRCMIEVSLSSQQPR